MGGGCTCENIKKNFFSSADFEINKPNYNINLQNKNGQASLNKNNVSTITNKKGNTLLNNEDENKNILFNEIIGNSSKNSINSENSKKKENNRPLNSQINNDFSDQINKEILTPFHINNRGRRSSFLDGVENIESATPKVVIDKAKLEEKTKGKKKAFSNFCQNK